MTSDKHMVAAIRALMVPDHEYASSVAAALANAEREASANLISIIADIRQKSGAGGKPMLGELADAIAERIADARREGMKRAAEIVRDGSHLHGLDVAYFVDGKIAAILSEADNQSRQPVPSQADRDAGSDEHLPVATGSNSSEVS